jgi:heme-degrading monooxygenase HmoA
MAITITNHAPGMPAEAYDASMAEVGDALRRADGFVAHTASVTPEGVTVTEVWESCDHWRRWFDAAVKPHLPPGAPDPVITELHNAVAR